MPANKEAFIRYRIIDRLLSNSKNRYPSMEDIIGEIETKLGTSFSVSAVQKDIKAMKEDELLGYKAPIAYSRSYHGYYYKDEGYSITQIPLNASDISSIEFVAMQMQQFQDVEMFKDFGATVSKIFDAVNISTLLDEDEVKEIVQFEKVPFYKGSEFISRLLPLIRDRKVIQFDYQKFNEEAPTKRTLHPYLLKEYRNRWYLIGMQEPQKRISTFALDRISKIIVTKQNFEWHADFSSQTYFQHAYGITTFEGKPQSVRLKFTKASSGYIKTQPLHSTQKILKENSKSLEIELNVGITIELIMDILSYGSNVKVLSPKFLVTTIREKLLENIRLY